MHCEGQLYAKSIKSEENIEIHMFLSKVRERDILVFGPEAEY